MMLPYIQIDNYSDPRNPLQNITAYLFIDSLFGNFAQGSGQLTLSIYADPADFGVKKPIETLTVNTGGWISPGRRVGPVFPVMSKIETDQASAWGSLLTYFLEILITMDRLPNSTVVGLS